MHTGGIDMNKNICRLMGQNIYLSILRDDEYALEKYIEWMSNETTAMYIEKNGDIVDVSRMPGWVNDNSVMRMGIVCKETDQLIGYCHIDHRKRDFVAWLSINIGEADMRGKGIGKEVISILCRFCFNELGVNSIHADVLETNERSIRCFESVGFRKSGIYRGHGFHNGEFHNWIHMDMLASEWQAMY